RTDAAVFLRARLHTLLNRAMEKPELDREAFADFRRGLLRHIAIEEKLLSSDTYFYELRRHPDLRGCRGHRAR
ncbi:MAG TPA: hypothetical protein VFV95_03650, partial [Vicinamibacterales bacterium]|nr:hypothetical protein [Vicinamibacterales bacterium]